MIVADYLAQLERLPVGRVADLTDDAPYLVLSPHADDETLDAAGSWRSRPPRTAPATW